MARRTVRRGRDPTMPRSVREALTGLLIFRFPRHGGRAMRRLPITVNRGRRQMS